MHLDIEPDTVDAGESAIIRWDVSGATRTYIFGLGLVDSSGQQVLEPTKSMNVVLVAEGSGGTAVTSAEIIVLGGPRDGEFALEDEFRHPLHFNVPGPSLPDLMEHVRVVLQDSMRYSVMLLALPDGRVRFITSFRTKPELVKPEETRIGKRRVAYLVDVSGRSGSVPTVSYTIRTLIQYQRRIERAWRLETDQEMFHDQARHLAEAIESGS